MLSDRSGQTYQRQQCRHHWRIGGAFWSGRFGLLVVILIGTVCASGTLQAQTTIVLPGAVVETRPPIKVPCQQAGVLTTVTVKEGSRVGTGQFLAKIDAAELELQLQQNRLDHQVAQMQAANTTDRDYYEKSMVVATAEYNRSVAANRRVENSVPLSKLEKQRLEKERTELQVAQANQQLQIAEFQTRLTGNQIQVAQMNLDRTQISAPAEGLVVRVEKQAGEWVQQSETICEIVNTTDLRIVGTAIAQQASKIRPGMPATVHFKQPWLSQEKVHGIVSFVAPAANPLSQKVPITVEIKNPTQKLMAGLTGEVTIELVDPTSQTAETNTAESTR